MSMRFGFFYKRILPAYQQKKETVHITTRKTTFCADFAKIPNVFVTKVCGTICRIKKEMSYRTHKKRFALVQPKMEKSSAA